MQTRPLGFNGATGRVGRLLRPLMPDAVWTSRGDGWGGCEGARAWVCLGGATSGDDDSLAVNSRAALDALEQARRVGVPRVFLLSSAAIYGRATGPLRADASPSPANPYGASKARMEADVASWRVQNPDGPEAVVLRLGNVVGADMLSANLQRGNPIRLDTFADGKTPRRSYVGPATLIRIFGALAAEPELPTILNVAAPGVVAMGDLVRAAGVSFDSIPAPETALPEVALDVGPLTRMMTFGPEDTNAEGMVTQWRKALAAAT